jgi:hypothetical protein
MGWDGMGDGCRWHREHEGVVRAPLARVDIDVRLGLEQRTHRELVPVVRSDHQRRHLHTRRVVHHLEVEQFGVAPVLRVREHVDGLRRAMLGREPQRSLAVGVFALELGAAP